MESMHAHCIEENRKEYAEAYAQLCFPTPREAEALMSQRQALLEKLDASSSIICRGSKIHSGTLSPGCAICTRGQWSCLFINNLCNGRCFYCPTSQQKKSLPETNNLSFSQAKDYVDYLDIFNFAGASISGGEPLITPDRTFLFVEQIKKKLGNRIHLWLYTNGILADDANLRRLADLGLDEIRFDLSARDYATDKLSIAAQCIPTVTVEIPAIPEDYARLSALLPHLAEKGVKHLNLHQLRLTPFNAEKFRQRPYTFSHGNKVTVIDSELTTLKLVCDTLESGGPAINYCSYAYKNRYQGAAARKRAAECLVKPYEDITAASYIRSMFIKDSLENCQKLAQRLDSIRSDSVAWQIEKEGRLRFSSSLMPEIRRLYRGDMLVSYARCSIGDKNAYQGSYVDIPLNKKRKIVAQRRTVLANRRLPQEAIASFTHIFLVPGSEQIELKEPMRSEALFTELSDVAEYERPPDGLPRYF